MVQQNRKHDISIVTIVYNGDAYIEKCIQSVLRQKNAGIEYIIIDGGSTDKTIEIINKYSDQIDVIVSEPDKGISDAFNKGIKLAQGELIALLNADDYYEDNILETVWNYYRQLLLNRQITKEELVVIHGKIRMFNEDGNKVYAPGKIEDIKYHLPIFHPTCFCSRSVYARHLYNLDARIAMDYELISKIYVDQGAFFYLDSVITNMYKGGISNQLAIKGFKEVCKYSQINLKVSSFLAYSNYLRRIVLYYLIRIKKVIS